MLRCLLSEGRFLNTFYREIVSNEQVSYKNKNSTKNIHVPFIQISSTVDILPHLLYHLYSHIHLHVFPN